MVVFNGHVKSSYICPCALFWRGGGGGAINLDLDLFITFKEPLINIRFQAVSYPRFLGSLPAPACSGCLLPRRWRDRTRRSPYSPPSPTGPLSACTASAMSDDGSSRSPASVHRQPARNPSRTPTTFDKSQYFRLLSSERPEMKEEKRIHNKGRFTVRVKATVSRRYFF